MALEALDFYFQQQQQQDSTFFTSKDPLHSFLESTPTWAPPNFNHIAGGDGDGEFPLESQTEPFFHLQYHSEDHQNWENYFFPTLLSGGDPSSSSSPVAAAEEQHTAAAVPLPRQGKKKPRRARSSKNKEEVESQRITHIAVERNRRKQMNEYLSVLRSLMPRSYVQRGDQASIVGGAINFVKELEQRLQNLGATTHRRETNCAPFAEFFTFPQYSSCSPCSAASPPAVAGENCGNVDAGQCEKKLRRVGDVEVTMVESHASVRVRWRKQARQLLRLVAGLQSLRLSVLHLNVTTATAAADDDDRQIVLYSLSLKVEDDCRLSTVDEIAAAVYEMLDDTITQ